MSGWIWWLVVAGGFGAGEVLLTTGFWLAPFALAAALGALVEAVGLGEPVAIVVFLAAALGGLLGLRPVLASRLLRSTPTLRTGAAALIGQRAVVLERIDNREAVGSIRVAGEVWTARAYDDGQDIPAGTDVEVVAIRGATAVVME